MAAAACLPARLVQQSRRGKGRQTIGMGAKPWRFHSDQKLFFDVLCFCPILSRCSRCSFDLRYGIFVSTLAYSIFSQSIHSYELLEGWKDNQAFKIYSPFWYFKDVSSALEELGGIHFCFGLPGSSRSFESGPLQLHKKNEKATVAEVWYSQTLQQLLLRYFTITTNAEVGDLGNVVYSGKFRGDLHFLQRKVSCS